MHKNNMNVNRYLTNTEDSQKHETNNYKGKMGVPHWNGQRQNPLGL